MLKVQMVARHWWLMPVILATQEAELKRMAVVQTSPGKSFPRPYFKNIQHKTGLAEWLKW
jgi:hypothetical protein